jgi:hypothetical protein
VALFLSYISHDGGHGHSHDGGHGHAHGAAASARKPGARYAFVVFNDGREFEVEWTAEETVAAFKARVATMASCSASALSLVVDGNSDCLVDSATMGASEMSNDVHVAASLHK